MNLINTPIETLSECIYDAQHVNLSVIHYESKQWHESKVRGEDVFEHKTRNPRKDEFAVVAMFPQMWGSTALGFDGIGGSAMTTAYTVVIQAQNGHSREVLVYFDGRFAYRISEPNELFWSDVSSQNAASIRDCEKYESKRKIK